MAIDTADKRRSAAGWYVAPNGAINTLADRLSAAGWYSAVVVQGAAGNQVTSIFAVYRNTPLVGVYRNTSLAAVMEAQ